MAAPPLLVPRRPTKYWRCPVPLVGRGRQVLISSRPPPGDRSLVHGKCTWLLDRPKGNECIVSPINLLPLTASCGGRWTGQRRHERGRCSRQPARSVGPPTLKDNKSFSYVPLHEFVVIYNLLNMSSGCRCCFL